MKYIIKYYNLFSLDIFEVHSINLSLSSKLIELELSFNTSLISSLVSCFISSFLLVFSCLFFCSSSGLFSIDFSNYNQCRLGCQDVFKKIVDKEKSGGYNHFVIFFERKTAVCCKNGGQAYEKCLRKSSLHPLCRRGNEKNLFCGPQVFHMEKALDSPCGKRERAGA